jgi:hypothetical protein
MRQPSWPHFAQSTVLTISPSASKTVSQGDAADQPERESSVQFRYRPLLADSNIRLLTVRPGLFNDPIRCELEEASISGAYEALSYLWGDPNHTSPISLNGSTFEITKNLECALRHLRCKESSRCLWVDAVCINQRNKDEKSKQVRRMGEIYSQATKVYAWLGEPDPQIDCVFTVLQEFKNRKKQETCPADFDDAEQLSFYRQLFCDTYQSVAGALPERSDLDDGQLHEEINWLRPLYVKPYWRRVWIVQELVLAKAVVVCCGGKSIDFEDIYGLGRDWGSFEQGWDTGMYRMSSPHARGWYTILTISGHRGRREVLGWEIGKETVGGITIEVSQREDVAMLDKVVEIYAQHHECSLPKDKVYGFLELVPQWKENLVVDYERSDLEVFLDVVRLNLIGQWGWHVALHLWSAMGLGDSEMFTSCIQHYLPEVCSQH